MDLNILNAMQSCSQGTPEMIPNQAIIVQRVTFRKRENRVKITRRKYDSTLRNIMDPKWPSKQKLIEGDTGKLRLQTLLIQ